MSRWSSSTNNTNSSNHISPNPNNGVSSTYPPPYQQPPTTMPTSYQAHSGYPPHSTHHAYPPPPSQQHQNMPPPHSQHPHYSSHQPYHPPPPSYQQPGYSYPPSQLPPQQQYAYPSSAPLPPPPSSYHPPQTHGHNPTFPPPIPHPVVSQSTPLAPPLAISYPPNPNPHMLPPPHPMNAFPPPTYNPHVPSVVLPPPPTKPREKKVFIPSPSSLLKLFSYNQDPDSIIEMEAAAIVLEMFSMTVKTSSNPQSPETSLSSFISRIKPFIALAVYNSYFLHITDNFSSYKIDQSKEDFVTNITKNEDDDSTETSTTSSIQAHITNSTFTLEIFLHIVLYGINSYLQETVNKPKSTHTSVERDVQSLFGANHDDDLENNGDSSQNTLTQNTHILHSKNTSEKSSISLSSLQICVVTVVHEIVMVLGELRKCKPSIDHDVKDDYGLTSLSAYIHDLLSSETDTTTSTTSTNSNSDTDTDPNSAPTTDSTKSEDSSIDNMTQTSTLDSSASLPSPTLELPSIFYKVLGLATLDIPYTTLPILITLLSTWNVCNILVFPDFIDVLSTVARCIQYSPKSLVHQVEDDTDPLPRKQFWIPNTAPASIIHNSIMSSYNGILDIYEYCIKLNEEAAECMKSPVFDDLDIPSISPIVVRALLLLQLQSNRVPRNMIDKAMKLLPRKYKPSYAEYKYEYDNDYMANKHEINKADSLPLSYSHYIAVNESNSNSILDKLNASSVISVLADKYANNSTFQGISTNKRKRRDEVSDDEHEEPMINTLSSYNYHDISDEVNMEFQKLSSDDSYASICQKMESEIHEKLIQAQQEL